MTIAITGAHGQLGNELNTILTNGFSELGTLPSQLQYSNIICIDVDELDISDGIAIDSFFLERTIDIVFNCAAMTNVDGCETHEDTAYKVNALGPKNLAIACEKHGTRLIHVSTDYVFAGDASRPYLEIDLPNPQTAYGRTKLAGEQFVIEHCSNSVVCRTAWLYGYEGLNFVKTMVRLGKGKESLSVVNDQIGNPTSAVDLAYQLVQLAVSTETGIFHATCNGKPVSWYTFAKRIMDKAGIAIPVIPCTTREFPRPAKRPAYSALDNSRLRTTIGDSMRDWDVALDSFMEKYLILERMQ